MSNPISDHSEYWNNVYSGFHESQPSRKSVWNEQPTPFFERLMPFLKFKGVKTIMDAGCGDGRNLAPMINASFDVLGVDSSSKALAYCRNNYPHSKNLRLIESSLDHITLPPESFDAIICDHVLTHIRNVKDVLKQFHNLLKKGGFALLEFTSHQDSTFGKGQKLSENEFLQNGVYLRYDQLEDIKRMLSDFDILCFTAEHSTDPPHGKGYIRDERHKHHSYFVIARKN